MLTRAREGREEPTFTFPLGRGKDFFVTFPLTPCLASRASTCDFLTSFSTSLTRAARRRSSSAFDAAACCFFAFSWATTVLERREPGRSIRPGLALERVTKTQLGFL